jgi:hypothetical protein
MRSGSCLLAKSNAGEHLLEHGNERLVGGVLEHPGPSEQRGLADLDDGQPEEEIRLGSEAAIGSVGIAFRAAKRTVKEAFGVVPVNGPGQRPVS